MRKTLILLVFLAPLTACSDRYRYSCQDPDNNNKTECQCEEGTRTKNKALGALDLTTTTIQKIRGIDC